MGNINALVEIDLSKLKPNVNKAAIGGAIGASAAQAGGLPIAFGQAAGIGAGAAVAGSALAKKIASKFNKAA